MSPKTPFFLLLATTLAAAAPAALAQYKVVGPDGSVTYTDRPPPAEAGKSGVMQRSPQAGGAPATPMPVELREAMRRYPVTLYATTDCPPCDAGRKLLQDRGIPFTEKRVLSEEDAEAMQRLTGARTVPSLTIGSQALRGLAEADWQIYLDTAGYPRESILPRNYQAPAATPLVEQRPAAAPTRTAQRPAAASAPTAPAAPPPAPTPGGIRF